MRILIHAVSIRWHYPPTSNPSKKQKREEATAHRLCAIASSLSIVCFHDYHISHDGEYHSPSSSESSVSVFLPFICSSSSGVYSSS